MRFPRATWPANQKADSIKLVGRAHWRHLDSHGDILAEGDDPNSLSLQGADYMLNVALTHGTQLAANALYMGLYTTTPTTSYTAAIATTNELTGATGYARAQISSWTVSQVTNWRATTPQITFTNSGGGAWTAVTGIAFVDAASGNGGTVGFSFIALSTSRTLNAGDSLQVTYYIQLS